MGTSYPTGSSSGIALLIFLIGIIISKAAGPEVTPLIGSWLTVLGELMESISGTEQFIEDKRRRKEKEIKELEKQMQAIRKRLDQLS